MWPDFSYRCFAKLKFERRRNEHADDLVADGTGFV